jgi:glycosyltransferase involved in cell wall biosynthesis
VLAPFPEVARAAMDSGLVLAPSTLSSPPPWDGRTTPGGFDPDFLAVGRGAKSVVDFWVERAIDDATRPVTTGVVERTWLDDVPALFRHEVLRDPGYAIAWWNLHERPLATTEDGTLTAAGSPARFMHLAGYEPDQPWLLRADRSDRTPVLLSQRPELRALCDAYQAELLAEGSAPMAYGFASFPDGTPITASMRGLFRASLAASDAGDVPPHPFGPDRGAAFRSWLRSPGSPAEAHSGFNRLTMWVWSSRVDLQIAFPHPLSEHADGYRGWCRTHGVTDAGLPDWALPGPPTAIEPPVDEFGVNLAGYLTGELGLGEMGRVVHAALRHADIPVASVVEELSLARLVGTGLAAPDTVGEPRFPVSVIAVNADFTNAVLANHPALGHQRYRIGLWAWELEDFPEAHRAAFGLVDEVWTVSEFCRTSIAAHATVPVRVFPVPVADPGVPHRPSRPPGTPTRFLFAFDYNSTGGRKNPWGLVAAFRRAFPDRADVRLVIKAHNAHTNVAAAERLRYLVADDPRIELIERFLSPAELDELYATSDAYVSLHRSEGFGLTLAEAMIRGLPAIATDYSGSAEFVTAETGWLVPHTMVEVGPGWPPYQADARWAEPDTDAAARAMRAVVDDPEQACGRGLAGREHLLRTRSMDAAGDWLRVRLAEAHQTWQRTHRPERTGLTRRVARRALRELRR